MSSLKIVVCLLVLCCPNMVQAQKPWSGEYGKEWLANKYGQTWLRIGVSQNGIHKVTLPASFQNKPGQLHLYHRGVEVSLINASDKEIQFYGVSNDGVTDALLYRPFTGTRQNPYYSWFSDESVYFLTFSSLLPVKLITSQKEVPISGSRELYHMQSDLTVFTVSDTYDGSQNYVYHELDQSYFKEGKGRSSKAVFKIDQGTGSPGNPVFDFPFVLKNLVVDSERQPKIQIQLNGRTFSSNSIKASVGKTSATEKTYPDLISFSDFIPYTQEYNLKASKESADSDVDSNGNGYFKLESVKITDSYSSTGIFSVNFIKTIYPQAFDMSGVNSKAFNLLPSASGYSNLSITNCPSDAHVYDITNIENPRLISGNYVGSTLQLMVERSINKELNLLVSSEVISVGSNKVTSVIFEDYSPVDKDYLIITNETLRAAVNNYADYRSSEKGGGYKTLIVNIKDIYNQFNYGEPSPVAIRRFVDYMLSKGVRAKHNLLLVGISTTLWNKMVRELPDEIPTIGFPGSDMLLVEGLSGTPANVPAIPIGRISASNNAQVTNYLNKVKAFESNDDLAWNKKVLHLSGGKSAQEIQQLAGMLSNLAPIVENGKIGGKVSAFVKKSIVEVENVDIASEVNEGVGMISYCGHGSSTITDFDLGYVTDPKRGYGNIDKYPFIYFNGCGVGNIFNGRNNTNITAGDKLPLSSDWVNSERGSIAIIANSYYSFLSSSSRYLNELYRHLFVEGGSPSGSIGQIQKDVARIIITQSHGDFDLANIHQSLLQGDPALNLVKVGKTDYSVGKFDGLVLSSGDKDKNIGHASSINIGAVISNKGKYIMDQSIPLKLSIVYQDGSTKVEAFTHTSISFEDTVYHNIKNEKALQKISLVIDSENTISEASKANNYTELSIDWEEARNVKVYSLFNSKDLIKPILDVRFNEEIVKNDQIFSSVPAISIKLMDNNNFLSTDTTLMDLYIKPCGDDFCDFQRQSYNGDKISLSLNPDGSLTLTFMPVNMRDGVYELLVGGKDVAGNSVAKSYKIKFQIRVESTAQTNLVVSPNPFLDYVRFELKDVKETPASIQTFIYDIFGRVVLESGERPYFINWYWIPKVASGIYIYRVILKNTAGRETVFSGKLVSANGGSIK